MKIARWYTVHEKTPEVAGSYSVFIMEPFSDNSNRVTVKYYNGKTWVDYKNSNDCNGIVLYWSDFDVHTWYKELGPGWYAKQNNISQISEAERLALEEVERAIENYNLIKALTQ